MVNVNELRVKDTNLISPSGVVHLVLGLDAAAVWLREYQGANPNGPYKTVPISDLTTWEKEDSRVDVTLQCSLIYDEGSKEFKLMHGTTDIGNTLTEYDIEALKIFRKGVKASQK